MRAKYSFLDKEVAIEKIEELYNLYKGEESEDFKLSTPMTIGGHTIVYLGQLVKEGAIYDQEGNVVTEATFYDDYAVDVLWRVKKDEYEYNEEGELIDTIVAVQDYEGWEEYKVEVTNPKHSFS